MAPRVLVGIDLLAVSHVSDAIARFGARYLQRIYTERELSECAGVAERLAARFAAKEATLKALRKHDQGFDWRSVEVQRAPNGAVDLVLHGEAKVIADAAGVQSWSLSMSHEASYATAVVVGVSNE